MKRNQIKLILLLLTQSGFAATLPSHAENLEEGVSYPYPFFYDDTDSAIDEEASNPQSKADGSKDASPPAWQGKIGNAEVTVDVENTDFISQCQAEWESKRKKDAPKEKKESRFGKDKDEQKEEKKEDHSPRVKISAKWGL